MRKIILTVAVTLCAAALYAQKPTEGISQQIEVTKQYVPEVEGARKLSLQPVIGDTVTLKPDIVYGITPTPWKSIFGTQPIAPVSISTAEYRPAKPFYIKAAAGYPLQSVFDFYAAAPCDPARGKFGLYVNHYGQWSEKSYMNAEIAPWSENRVGMYGGVKIGRRMLDIDLDYGFRYYSTDITLSDGSFAERINSIKYNSVGAVIKYGDAFTDFSRFNYRFGVSGDWLKDARSFNDYSGGAFADFGFGVKNGVIIIGVDFNGWFRSDRHDWYVGLKPEYNLDIKKFSLKAGVKLYYNNFLYNPQDGVRNKVRFIPDVKLSYIVFPELVPYINLGGELCDGSFAAMSRLNPYIFSGTFIERQSFKDFRGGIRGSAAELVTYDAFVGYDLGTMPVFMNGSNAFLPINMDMRWFFAGARVKLALPLGFAAEISGQYSDLEQQYVGSGSGYSMPLGDGIPKFTLGAKLSYNCKDRLFLNAGVEYSGKRSLAGIQTPMIGVPETVNLYVGAEYVIKGRTSVFAVGDNLLNAEIYRYLGYRALGPSVMAGVKFNF